MRKVCPLLTTEHGKPCQCRGEECMFSKEKSYLDENGRQNITQECLIVKALQKYACGRYDI